jgi:L-fuculose-phosphate aldolase
LINHPAELVAYIAGLMFDRRLTDIAGGNVSARQGDTVYLTPRYAGQRWHWKPAPEDIVSGAGGHEL